MLLKVEELLGFDDGEGALDPAALQQVTKGSGSRVARIVPALKCQQGSGPAEGGLFEASHGVHDEKAIEREP